MNRTDGTANSGVDGLSCRDTLPWRGSGEKNDLSLDGRRREEEG